jgi:hypothetical protein
MIDAAGFTALAIAGTTLREAPGRTALLDLDAEREDRAVRDGFAGRIARQRAAGLLSLCGDWCPDLLVCDEMDFGAMVAAERLGLPHAAVVVIAAGGLARPELVAGPLNALRAEHGLGPDPDLAMVGRHLVLSPVPQRFRDPAWPLPATARLFRPEGAADGPGPAWLAGLPDGPMAYVTLGTVFNQESGDLFERILAGLRDLPLTVIVTVGRGIDPADLGAQSANVRVERHVPQSLVLPRCDLVVSHAGSGSVLGALAHGLPSVLLPIGADQPLNARRCKQLGVGRVLDALRSTPADIRAAAQVVLADPAYRQAAQAMQREIADMPDVTAVVPALERLAGRG